MTAEEQNKALQMARMQIAQQQMQALLAGASKVCFDGCVTSPSSSLSKREETCLAMCYDKYNAVLQSVIKSLSNK